MARSKKNDVTPNAEIVVDGGVQLVSPNLEQKLTSNLSNTPTDVEVGVESEVEVTVLKEAQPVVAPVKMVKVLLKEDHKCFIGGEWYYLLKDKQYNVPENVKNILKRADKLQTL